MASISLEDLLLRHQVITKEQLDKAKDEQRRWGGDIGRSLVDLGFMTEELLMKAYAHQRSIPFTNPAEDPLDPKVACTLGVQICERFEVICVAHDAAKKMVRIATSEPTNKDMQRQVASICNMTVELATATSSSIARAIRKYFYGEDIGPPAARANTAPARGAEPKSVEGTPSEAPTATPAAPAPSPESSKVLDELAERVVLLQTYVASLKTQILDELTSNPYIAGLAARVDLLEQVAENDVSQLRALTDLLVQKGLLTREEINAKLKV
jgi:type IV pilus assembly protein PilB